MLGLGMASLMRGSPWTKSALHDHNLGSVCTRYPSSNGHCGYPLQWSIHRREKRRRLGVKARSGSEPGSSASQVVLFNESVELSTDLDNLMEVLRSEKMSEGKLNVCEGIGREVSNKAETLRTELETRSMELVELNAELQMVTDELQETSVLLAACQGELEFSTTSVEHLKEEVEAVHASREEELRSTLARYRELEEALAMAENELGARPLDDISWVSGEGVEKLKETVKNQEAVLDDLFATLEKAKLDKAQAEAAVREMEKTVASQEEKLVNLQSQHNTLQAIVEDSKSTLAASEMNWAKERKESHAEEAKLQHEVLASNQLLAEKTSALDSANETLTDLQSQLSDQLKHTAELEARYSELSISKKGFREGKRLDRAGGPGDKQVKMKALEAKVKAAHAELAQVHDRKKELEDRVRDLTKEVLLKDNQAARLQSVVEDIQQQLRHKSEELSSANSEKQRAVLEAQHTGQQLKAFEAELSRLRSRLDSKMKQVDELTIELEASQTKEVKGITALARVQQKLEQQLELEISQAGEANDLKDKVVQLRTQLLKQEQEHKDYRKARESEVTEMQLQVDSLQKSVGSVENEVSSREEALKAEMAELRELAEKEKAQSVVDASNLRAEVEMLESKLEHTLLDQESSRAQILQLQAAKKKAEEDLADPQSEASSTGKKSDVDSLKKELEIEQNISKGKGLELAEAATVISELSNQIESLQEALEAKCTELDGIKVNFASKNASSRQSVESLRNEVKSMQDILKSKQNSLESAMKGKQSAEVKIDDLEKQLLSKDRNTAELSEQLSSKQQKCFNLRTELNGSQAALEDLRRTTAEEMDATARLLEKAEKVALATRKSMVQSQKKEVKKSSPASPEYEKELKAQISKLQVLLEEQSATAAQAVHHSQELEDEVTTLSRKVMHLEREAAQAPDKTNTTLQSLQSQLSDVMAREASAKQEAQNLRKKVKSMQGSTSKQTSKDQSSSGSDGASNEELESVKAHADKLQEENNRLRRMAAKRNEVLAQSRKFIEQYLERSVTVLGE